MRIGVVADDVAGIAPRLQQPHRLGLLDVPSDHERRSSQALRLQRVQDRSISCRSREHRRINDTEVVEGETDSGRPALGGRFRPKGRTGT
jgi:hypothetical protein